MPHVADPLEGLRSALDGRYTIEREIGSGGMATVYLAQDLKHSRQVAIKVMRPELATSLGAERFLREIQISAQLSHPNILTLIDSGEAGGLLYYAMPYVEGESLRERLEREQQLPLDEALQITQEVADGLSYAHSLGVVHRDIKPENILLSGGHAVITDFGIARAVTEAGGEKLTETGIAVGTPVYMSPEQASGQSQLDARSDIYSLGILLYEMLVGDPPFTGSSAQAILARKSLEQVPSLRTVRETVSPGIEQVVLKSLAKLPADRYATAGQFAEALSRPPSVAPPAVSRRRRVGTVATVIVLVGAAATLSWLNGGFGAATPDEAPRVLVRPFALLGSDQEEEYLAAGLTTEVRNLLTTTTAVTVFGEATGLRARDMTEAELQEELPQADYVLDGAVQVSSAAGGGQQFRVTASLTRTADGSQVWALPSEPRTTLNVDAVRSQIVTQALAGLGIVLAEELASRQHTASQAAQEAYLKGLHHLDRLTPEGYARAAEYFLEASAIDSNYAAAHAGLGLAYLGRGSWWGDLPPDSAYPLARRAAERALSLDPAQGDAYRVVGGVQVVYEWDFAAAETSLRRAIELAPSSAPAHHGLGGFLRLWGLPHEALPLTRRAVQLDPLNGLNLAEHAAAFDASGMPDSAHAVLVEALELNPEHPAANFIMATLLVRQGDLSGAIEVLEEYGTPYSLGYLGALYARAGRTQEARQIIDWLEGEPRSRNWEIGQINAALGNEAEAVERLRQAYLGREAVVIALAMRGMRWSPYDALRGNPEFEEMERDMINRIPAR